MPKRLWFGCLMAALLSHGLEAARGQSATLLQNPGFEEGKTLPEAWTVKAAAGSRGFWENKSVHRGRRCLGLEGTGPDGTVTWNSKPISLESGRRYVVSAYCKTRSVGEKRGWIWISTFDKDHKWKRDHFLIKTEGTQDWHRVAGSITPRPEEKYAALTVKLYGAGHLWVDDVEWVPARTKINEHRVLLIQDRPFFPMGVYVGTASPAILPDLKRAGFNCVLSYSLSYQDAAAMRNYLAQADKSGLKVAISWKDYLTPYRHADPRTWLTREKILLGMEAIRSHPALLTWYMADEPELQGVSLDDAIKTYLWFHHLDGDHPVSACFCRSPALDVYARTTDVIMPDVYPVPNSPLSDVAAAVKRSREASSPQQPIWAVLQAFDSSYFSEKKEPGLRPPTYDELRCMTWQAIVQGATGLFYFCYDMGAYKIYEHPETWTALKKVVAEVREFVPVLVADSTPLRVGVSGGNSVKVLSKKYQGTTYVIAVNEGPVLHRQVRFKLTGAPEAASVDVWGESRAIPATRAEFTDQFEPYAVHIYRIRPATSRPESAR